MPRHPADTETAWYPLFVNLRGRRVLVVGGNAVAERKTRRLLAAGAEVDIVAEGLQGALADWHGRGKLNLIGNRLEEPMIPGHILVLVADADSMTRARARKLADRHDVLVNVVDELQLSSAIVPAVVDRSPLMIAVGSGGNAPELARMIRSRLERLLPESLGPLAALTGSFRDRIRRRLPAAARRRKFLEWLLTGPPARDVEAGRQERARQRVARAIQQPELPAPGHVSLVGAGPGDPELLTIKALRRIQEADVIIHDGLVDKRIFEYARRDAEFIDVAKRPGSCRVTQDRIHELLSVHARAGKRVVRLKGGDPMVFGRGGEELAFLRHHRIEYEVIPGVTAASACGAYAGIPLTHRGLAQSVRLVTAHCARSIDRLDWPALAADNQTLAFYMAVGQLEVIEQRLIAHGRDRSTPFALVENGTRKNQRVIAGRLDRLSELGRSHRLQSPAMLFVGEVAAMAGRLAWFGDEFIGDPARPETRLRATG